MLFYNKIRKTIGKQKISDLIGSILNIISVAISILFLMSIIEYFSEGDIVFRKILFFSFLALSFGLILYQILIYYWHYIKPNFDEIIKIYSNKIGDHFPKIKDNLYNNLQFLELETKSELVTASIERFSSLSKNYNFDEIIDKKKLKKNLVFFLISLISLFIIFITPLKESYSRILNYNKSYLPNVTFNINYDKSLKNSILKGTDYNIIINAKGSNIPNILRLKIKEENQNNFEILELKNNNNQFQFNITSVNNSFSFYAETEWYSSLVQTELFKVNVTEIPFIKSLVGEVIPPSYIKGERQELQNTGDIIALSGSSVKLRINSNKKLKHAELIYINEKQIDTNITFSNDTIIADIRDYNANFNFKLKESGYYYINIVDIDNYNNQNPIKYTILIQNDRFPEISILTPRENKTLDETAIVPFKLEITDDYGFKKLILSYRLINSRYAPPDAEFSVKEIRIKENILYQEIAYIFDFNELLITPEDEYELFFEVFDNDIVNGPKSTKTNSLIFRMPSFEEVLKDADRVQDVLKKELDNLLKESEMVKKDMDNLKQDLMKDYKKKEMNWEQKKKAEDLMKKQEKIAEKFEKLEEKLKETTQELKEKKLLSNETLEKFMKLQELMNQVNIPLMKNFKDKLNKELEKMSPQEMQKALENMEFDEEQFRKSIERTTKILERMNAEQKADALNKLSEKIEKDIDKLNEMTETNPNSKEIDKLHNQIQNDLNSLNKEMESLENMLQNLEGMPMEAFQETKETLENSDVVQDIKQSQENMKNNDSQSASKNQQSAKQKMSNINQKMKELQKEMKNAVSREELNAMKKAIKNLLELSKQQENLKNQTKNSNYSSKNLPDINREQGKLKEALNRVAQELTKLSEKSLAVTPEMGREIGKSMMEMQKANDELAERKTPQASNAQQNSMANLNNAISQMQSMLGQMQGQGEGDGQEGAGGNTPGADGEPKGSGGGQMSFQQSLQQAAAMQQMMNNSLQQMMQQGSQSGGTGIGEGLSEEQRAEYGRLKGEQGKAMSAIEEMKDNLEEKNPNSQKLKNELEKLSNEMKEVINDFESENISEETLKRQEKILSKMLDIHRSINEKDFELKREGQVSEQYRGVTPESIEYQEYLRKRAEEKLKKSMEAGYSKDYEKIINNYFKRLKEGTSPSK